MFVVTPEEAEAIQRAYRDRGELAAVAEFRRRYPVFEGCAGAVEAVRMIAGWRSPTTQSPAGPA